LFDGTFPTDAGGGADTPPGWSFLVVKDGCGWKHAKEDVSGYVDRTPDGGAVLVDQGEVEQCEIQIQLSVVRSATDIRSLTIRASRNLENVCPPETTRVDLQEEKGGTLSGATISSRSPDDANWTVTGSVVFEDGRYVLHDAAQ
jgi:hypothetical protein